MLGRALFSIVRAIRKKWERGDVMDGKMKKKEKKK
jgi:hypothetical protein